MFLVDAEVTLTEIGAHSPEMVAAVAESVERDSSDLDFFRPHEAFLRSPSASFDVAVMERTTRAAVLPVDFGWSDIGSREAVLEAGGVDGRGNCFVGDVLPLDVGRTLVHSSHRLVGAVGVDRLVIVETAEAVLVAGRSRVQDLGALVARLRGSGCSEHSLHTEMHRPWSSYEGVGRGERHQVKRIKAKPGASLSLQMRRRRAELWVVVRGVAEVTRGGETFALRENQSAYIPRGVKHRLRNAADGTLELIKVQVGDYLGEDDIVRFEDQYGRVPR